MKTGVMLMQISVYIVHKNLAVRKIMEVMCTASANVGLNLNTSQTTQEENNQGRHASTYCERKAHIICKQQCMSLYPWYL